MVTLSNFGCNPDLPRLLKFLWVIPNQWGVLPVMESTDRQMSVRLPDSAASANSATVVWLIFICR
jgi:hypothetical protein